MGLRDRFECLLFDGARDWLPVAEPDVDFADSPLVVRPDLPVEDLEYLAADARYRNGKIKRTRYPRVDLAARKVVIVLHQTGVQRDDASKRWPLTTCHRLITPAGRRCKIHPLDVRLVAANRFDRAPWHGITIEVAGNFEGDDGTGNWYRPDMFGAGRASDTQVAAVRAEVRAIADEVASMGAVVHAVAPHRVSGVSRTGRPNRPLCCGSRLWSLAGEPAAAELGARVPGPNWSLRGMTIPDSWRNDEIDSSGRWM